MKIRGNNLRFIFIVGLFIFGVRFIQASDVVTSIQWNAMAQSQILNNTELAKLNGIFPDWKIKQVVWPDESEINLNKVIVASNLISSCMEWLRKFITNDQLPVGLDKMLIPMKEWGVIGKESSTQGRLCDVFITRFKKGDVVVQIQESPYNIIVTFSNEKLKNSPVVKHKDLVIEVADLLLNSNLKPVVGSESLHIFEIVNNGQNITRVSWPIESVKFIDKHGNKCIDLHKAGEIGTTSVEAETDGRFVKFALIKEIEGAGVKPFVRRFSSSSR